MRVQLYTDASIVKGRGAWAALVLRGDAPPVEKAGPLRGNFRSSTATELCAIANGLHFARRAGLIEAGDEVEIWCDNTATIMWANGTARRLGGNSRKTDQKLFEARRHIRDFANRHRFTFHAAHVKGHQRLDSDDPRATFNIRCDELCSAVRDGTEPRSWNDHVARIDKHRAARAIREERKAAEDAPYVQARTMAAHLDSKGRE